MITLAKDKSRGNILPVIVLILIVLFALFVVVPFFVARRASPAVEEAFWTVDEAHVGEAFRGEEIEAWVRVKAVEDYTGSVVVKIRKDVAWWTDVDYEVSTFPVDLVAGEEKELSVAFMPNEVSTGRMRGYFVQVEFPKVGGSWTMENSYPPRLKVYD